MVFNSQTCCPALKKQDQIKRILMVQFMKQKLVKTERIK